MNQAGSWLKLDNVGKIFPSTSGKRNTGVFRFSCELTERIQKAPISIRLWILICSNSRIISRNNISIL